MEKFQLSHEIARGTSFDDFFSECTIKGIESMIGISSTQAILFTIKFPEKVRRPDRIHESHLAMLGVHGTYVVEKAAIKEMYSRLNEKKPGTP